MMISVFTPTYNGADTLHIVYDNMQSRQFKILNVLLWMMDQQIIQKML